jgi:cytoskeletal protein RodZ
VSAAMHQPIDLDTSTTGPGHGEESTTRPTPVVVRRNAGLAALVGAGASAIAIAYLWRATQSAAALDWALCLVMASIAAVYLTNLVDARTPLLVADELGVRIRLGNQWRGLPWDAVDRVVVQPRRGLFRDGRLMFAPHSLSRALDGLDVRGRRAAALNQKVYGAALTVPMGITTRVSAHGTDLADGIAALAQGRADVVVVQPEPEPEPEAAAPDTAAAPAGAETVGEDHQEAAPARTAGLLSRLTTRRDRAPEEPEQAGEPEQAADTREDRVPTAVAPTPPVAEPVVPQDEPAAPVGDAGDTDESDVPEDRPARRSLLGGLGTVVSRVAKGRSHDVDAEADDTDAEDTKTDDPGDPATEDESAEAAAPAPAARSAVPLRETRRALRAEVTRETPATVLGNVALHPDAHDADGRRRPSLPEGRELRRPGSVDLEFEAPPAASLFESGRVRPISTLGDPVDALVIDDFVTEPAYDPVIGPELAAARRRVGLSVDQLAERTRIRPHVIESIEVDDFAPCGGDFYARGHLRTLARVLGKDAAPLLAQFDERYATAPINARRVFEAELATGMTGSMRGTVGGPNWALLVGVVLVLVMTWGVVRLFASEPPELLQSPAPVLNGSAGVDAPRTATRGSAVAPAPVGRPIRLTLVGAQDGSEVVVRDGTGEVVWAGEIVLGEKRTIKALPPVTVKARDAGALEARVNGTDKGTLGELGQPGRRTFHRPAAH